MTTSEDSIKNDEIRKSLITSFKQAQQTINTIKQALLSYPDDDEPGRNLSTCDADPYCFVKPYAVDCFCRRDSDCCPGVKCRSNFCAHI